jgi:hypothetical protein
MILLMTMSQRHGTCACSCAITRIMCLCTWSRLHKTDVESGYGGVYTTHHLSTSISPGDPLAVPGRVVPL